MITFNMNVSMKKTLQKEKRHRILKKILEAAGEVLAGAILGSIIVTAMFYINSL